jgi:GT2 family glycosyltransferase
MNLSNAGVFAVVVTFRRYEELNQSIKALLNQGFNQSQVIVVENTPLKCRRSEVKERYPGLVWLEPEENIASAGGFALGMRTALEKGANWVWLFNDDSRPLPGAWESLSRAILHSPNPPPSLVKITPKDEDGTATVLDWKGVRSPRKVPIGSELITSDLITFDGALISAQVIRKIGTCDPLYFMGTYEFDFCLKAKEAVFGIYTLPNGMLEDGKLGSVGGNPPWRQYYNTRNHLWLGIHRRSIQTIFQWFKRETKQTVYILLKGDRKLERMTFKWRAFRDAIFNRRGKRYDPENYK